MHQPVDTTPIEPEKPKLVCPRCKKECDELVRNLGGRRCWKCFQSDSEWHANREHCFSPKL